jgi:hypothetical protein
MFRGVSDSPSALTFLPRTLKGSAADAPRTDNSFTEQLFLELKQSLQRVGAESGKLALPAHAPSSPSSSSQQEDRQNLADRAGVSTAPVSFTANGRIDLKPNYLSAEEARTGGLALDPVSGETRTFSVNRYAFVDRPTAERLAVMLGGTVQTRQVGENGGPFRGPVQYLIRVGKYAGDAAAISRRYENLPQWMAELTTRMAIARANGEKPPSWNKALAQLNRGQAVLGVRLA